MQQKKYELTDEMKSVMGKNLHRIRYLIDIPAHGIDAGDLGGWVENEENLSQTGNCCVIGNGCVLENGRVTENGCVAENGQVAGNGQVAENGCVIGNGRVDENGRVAGHGWIAENGCVIGNGRVNDSGRVDGHGCVTDDGLVTANCDIVMITGFLEENRTITFYRKKSGGIGVACHEFTGTLDGFRKNMQDIYGISEIVKEYLMIADLMEMHFARLGVRNE